jgi:glycosidase
MKYFYLLIVFFAGRSMAQQTITDTPGPQSPEVRVNPLNWFVGMQNPEVELMMYAPEIGKTTVHLQPYAGVTLKESHTVENPNYLFVDLDVAKEAAPGTLHFTLGEYHLDFELKRKNPGDGVSRILGVTDKDLVYLIMPDRFANGDPTNDVVPGMRDTSVNKDSANWRHGGDIKGVEDHLDYLKDLGVTTVWMTPVNENDNPMNSRMYTTYHGYAFTDQYHVDKRFGGNRAYAALAEALHQRGMKLIQDAVYNHVGFDHWTVLDMPMKDWLNQWPSYTQTNYKVEPLEDPYSSSIDRRRTVDGWFVRSMPDLNQRNPYVRRYLTQYAIWATETFGVDGWRVDTWFYSDKDFLNQVNAALVREFPRLTMFGEVWVGSVAEAAYWCENNLSLPYKANLQGVVDFNVCFAMQDALKNDGGAEKLYSTLAQDFLYKNPYRNCIMLDNHDMDRIYGTIGEDMLKFKMGIAWLLTLRGIPEMYYGTEILMHGLKSQGGDDAVRQNFPGGWPGDTLNEFTPAGRTGDVADAFNYVRTLAHYRAHSTALTGGHLMQYVPERGVYVYFRYDKLQSVMVVANTGREAQDVALDRFSERLGGFRSAKNIITGETVTFGDKLHVDVRQTLVLELQR